MGVKISYGTDAMDAYKVEEIVLPSVPTAVTIARKIKPAIRAYSMAVAPLVSVARFLTRDRAAWE